MDLPVLLTAGLQVNGESLTRDDFIGVYYHSGYTIGEIMGFLATRHGIAISERQIHRILRNMNLLRRNNNASLEDIVRAILHELSGSSQNLGYRLMRRRLLHEHELVASSEMVRLALSVLDAEGVTRRSRGSIRRRTYVNKGPNFAIHIDGWDKLKPYGVSIHGGIDGFSRRILWLTACDSNKKPEYVARCYIDYIKEINGVPIIIYADRGTENSITRDLQFALRWNHNDPFQGLSSFIYGSSTRNTRIERFWRNMRDMCGNFWINHLKDMADMGVLDTSDNLHLECVRYCFLPLISRDLKNTVRNWNEHRIRYNRHSECPSGKPNVLYFQPEIFLATDCKLPVPNRLDGIEQEYCIYPPARGVSMEFDTLAKYIIRQQRFRYPPSNVDGATELFCQLIFHIDQIN